MVEEILEKKKWPAKALEKITDSGSRGRHYGRIFLIVLVILILLGLLSCVAAFAYVKIYENKIYPGVYLGEYSLGGLTEIEVDQFSADMAKRLSEEGITYTLSQADGEKKIHLESILVQGDAALEIISLPVIKAGETAYRAGRESGGWHHFLNPLLLRFHPNRIFLTVKTDENNFKDALSQQLARFEVAPQEAGLKVNSVVPLKFEIISEQNGSIFDYDKIFKTTVEHLGQLNFNPIAIQLEERSAAVTIDDVIDPFLVLDKIFSYSDIELTYIDPQSKETVLRKIKLYSIAEWIKPFKEDGRVWYGLDPEKLAQHLETYKYTLDVEPVESRFVMENGKLKEFSVGQSGQVFNLEKTMAEIDALMKARNYGATNATSSVALIVEDLEPKMKLADVNNLGITTIIGVGTSTFRDSHTNRIKNIARAVERLNGTIIAPGEEFSTINYAGPFTLENGYLPEEVIKGNQIKKEIGGGMCQIGTTLFRMAMNSGMPITERTNHSLVVGYYADPVNGNPGTDATIYEPILDFKFLNDTGSYLLLETKIDYKKQMLTFVLWGKPDGRYGYYSHPLVSRWISPGEPQTIYTTSLAPGKQSCQNAFRGAVASFTYTRFTSTTEQLDRVFSSFYRPLQKICMVGIAPENCPNPENCQPPSEEAEETNGTSSEEGSGGNQSSPDSANTSTP